MGTHPHVDPSVSTSALQINDLFLLCSDGLTNLVTDQQIETILNQNTTLAIKAQNLVDLAKKHGGGDNITVLLVKVEDE